VRPLWPCYRLIAHGWAKLEELQRTWSVDDVYRAGDALNAWLDAQAPKEK
jgi:hypothetical protein